MVTYICICCKKEFTHKGDYMRHLNKKNKCNKIENIEQNNINKITKMTENKTEMTENKAKITENKAEITEIRTKITNITKITENKAKITEYDKGIEDNLEIIENKCKNCNKIYSSIQTLKRHEKSYCKGANYNSCKCKKCDKLFSKTCNARQHEKICNYVKQETNENKQQINNSTINNINNGNIVNNNIANNNIANIDNKNIDNKIINNITINAYGKENFEMCKIEKKFIMEYCFNSLCLYIKRIHFNKDKPENHNMFITNLKSNNVSVFDGKKIKLESYKTVFKRLNNYHYKLKFIYEDVKKDISKTCKRQFPIFLDFADESNESDFSKEYREDLSKEIKLLLYNEREMAMTTLRNKNIPLN